MLFDISVTTQAGEVFRFSMVDKSAVDASLDGAELVCGDEPPASVKVRPVLANG